MSLRCHHLIQSTRPSRLTNDTHDSPFPRSILPLLLLIMRCAAMVKLPMDVCRRSTIHSHQVLWRRISSANALCDGSYVRQNSRKSFMLAAWLFQCMVGYYGEWTVEFQVFLSQYMVIFGSTVQSWSSQETTHQLWKCRLF